MSKILPIPYKNVDVDEKVNVDCPICLESDKKSWIQFYVCGHEFHDECIQKWLIDHHDCPLCRRQVIIPMEVDHRPQLLSSHVCFTLLWTLVLMLTMTIVVLILRYI